jgi:hypothetical protein
MCCTELIDRPDLADFTQDHHSSCRLAKQQQWYKVVLSLQAKQPSREVGQLVSISLQLEIERLAPPAVPQLHLNC